MNNTGDRAPASVAENVEKVIQVESETLRPRSRSEAVTDMIGSGPYVQNAARRGR